MPVVQSKERVKSLDPKKSGHEGTLLIRNHKEKYHLFIVYFIFFSNVSWLVSASAPWSSILLDKFNEALATLTEDVNVSYFIRNPKDEG